MTEKTTEQKLEEKTKELDRLTQENNQLRRKGLMIAEENKQLAASPEIAVQVAEMEYHLKMAKQFVASKAFPNMTPEQAFTIIKAGEEMGLKPVEAMNSLYIVNGSINPYGMHMIGRLTGMGYKIEYFDENKDQVSVRITKEEDGKEVFNEVETAQANDPQLANSKALKFARSNKLRYHAVRKIINFYLPHLFGSITDFGTEAYKKESQSFEKNHYEKERERILEYIESCETVEELARVQHNVSSHDVGDAYDEKYDLLMNGKKEKDV